jgi:antitoxin ParD1/3/4
MPTRNVVLTDYQADFVERLVTSGRYQNASEVLREGLRLVEQEEAEAKARLKALREAVQVGIDDIDAGRFQTFTTRAELHRHLTKLTKQALGDKRAAKSNRSPM